MGEEVEEEPAFQYIPESPRVPNGGMESDPLVESIMLLQEGLEVGTALAQFEVQIIMLTNTELEFLGGKSTRLRASRFYLLYLKTSFTSQNQGYAYNFLFIILPDCVNSHHLIEGRTSDRAHFFSLQGGGCYIESKNCFKTHKM